MNAACRRSEVPCPERPLLVPSAFVRGLWGLELCDPDQTTREAHHALTPTEVRGGGVGSPPAHPMVCRGWSTPPGLSVCGSQRRPLGPQGTEGKPQENKPVRPPTRDSLVLRVRGTRRSDEAGSTQGVPTPTLLRWGRVGSTLDGPSLGSFTRTQTRAPEPPGE